MAALRGTLYLDAVEAFVASSRSSGLTTTLPGDLSLEEELCWRCLVARRDAPDVFQKLKSELSEFVAELEERRLKYITGSPYSSERERWQHWLDEGLVRDDPDPPVMLGHLVYGDRVDRYIGASGGYLVQKWGDVTQLALLEYVVHQPYEHILVHETEALSAAPPYSWFWFKSALDFRPRDAGIRALLMRVLGLVLHDSDRHVAYKAIALEALARNARTAEEAEPILVGAGSTNAEWRGISLHALGVWVSCNVMPADTEMRRAVASAEDRVRDAAASDEVEWVRKMCDSELRRIGQALDGELSREKAEPGPAGEQF
jgi:hypothetical protein